MKIPPAAEMIRPTNFLAVRDAIQRTVVVGESKSDGTLHLNDALADMDNPQPISESFLRYVLAVCDKTPKLTITNARKSLARLLQQGLVGPEFKAAKDILEDIDLELDTRDSNAVKHKSNLLHDVQVSPEDAPFRSLHDFIHAIENPLQREYMEALLLYYVKVSLREHPNKQAFEEAHRCMEAALGTMCENQPAPSMPAKKMLGQIDKALSFVREVIQSARKLDMPHPISR